MAATVAANLTLLDNNDNSGNWSGTDGPDAYNTHIQGTNSESWQVSKNSSETATWNDGSAHDMSAANTHLYLWLKSDLTNYYTTIKVRIRSSTGNYREYEIANQTTKIWNGAWKCYVLDLTGGTETGTFDSSDVNDIDIIIDNGASGNIRSVINNWIDVIRYGTGLTVTGTTFDLVDVAAIDQLEANQYGVLENLDGIIFGQGKVFIGNGATTTTFNSDNEVLAFRNLPYMKSGFYEFKLQGSGNTSVVEALTVRADGTDAVARFILDASNTDADVTFSGCSVTRAGLVSFSSNSDIQTTVFNDCLQITPSTSTFKYNTIVNYAGSEGGAVLWPSSDTNITDLTFSICDEDIELDASSDSTPSFSNIVHDDNAGDYDVNNTSGSSVTIPLSGTSNGNSYTGSLVTFEASVTLTFHVSEQESGADIQYARINIVNAATKVELYQIETNVSGVATQAHTYAGDLNIGGWVRQFDISGSDYVPKDFVGTIKSTGFDLNITLLKF